MKALRIAAALLAAAAVGVSAQSPGSVSLHVRPGVNLAVGESRELFGLGGGGEFAGDYSLPFAPFLSARGSVDYSLVPTTPAEPEEKATLSLITFAAGVVGSYSPTPKLRLEISGSGGYGLGLYKGEAGGSAYLGGGAHVGYQITPSLNVGAGAAYRHYVSDPTPFYQALTVSLGSSFRIGAGDKTNLRFIDTQLDPVFPVFYKHYNDHPLGTITLVNEEKGPIKNVRVSFFINQYMDEAKDCGLIPEIKKGEEKVVPLFALLSNRVLAVTEQTKVAAQISVKYEYAGAELTATQAETVRMYDRNAMSWDDDRRAAAFITPKDPDVLAFSRNVAGLVRESRTRAVNLEFCIAAGLFEALGLHGVNYVVDPRTPYVEFSKDRYAVDYLQFPVQTLSYKAGDCDDLSICYSSLLEATGIETAFVTVPGHILLAFSLGMAPAEAARTFRDDKGLIIREERVWVPVEVTLAGKSFVEAWEAGAKQWREHAAGGGAALIPVHSAWTEYEPVGLPSAEAGIQPPPSERLMARYTESIRRFVGREIDAEVTSLLEQIKRANDPAKLENRLGLLYARFGLYEQAKPVFEKAAARNHVPALINLGNLLFLEKKYEPSLAQYERALRLDPANVTGLLGAARAHYELENYGSARRAYGEASRLDPKLAQRFSYLVADSQEGARAAAAIREEAAWAE